ncbi:MAG: hypothetical protein NXI31_07600 [bacterium]|nr:hypothetical protein [bacterium]
MNFPFRSPALSLLFTATPILAQSETAPEAEEQVFEHDVIAAEEHEWQGLELDNLIVPDPALIGTRELNASDPMIAPFMNLLGTYTKFVADNLKGFDGSKSQREAAFHACNLILVTGVVWPPTMTAAGAGIGAIALSETGPGAIGGGVAGGVIGGAAGTGAMCAQVLLAVALAMEVNEKYPDVGTRDLGMADASQVPLFEDPEAWIVEDLFGPEGDGRPEGEVSDRNLNNPRMMMMRQRTRRSSYAGPWESLFIHMMREVAAPQVAQLARYWDRYPGLSRSNKRRLEQFSGLRPLVERLAYIRANSRLSSKGRRAMPLSGWQRTVSKVIQADSATMQRLWLDCFALGSTRLKVGSDKLTWSTPRALRNVGAPRSFSAGIKPVKARVTGFGGSLSASIEAGKFSIQLKNPTIRGDRIRVGWKIGRGRLLDVRLKGQLGPVRQNYRFSPKLRRDLTGYVEFAVKGYGLEVKRVSLGRLSLSVGLPKLPVALKPIEGLLKQIESRIVKGAKDVIGKQLRFDRVFGQLDRYVPKQMLNLLNKTADQFGMANITALRGLSLKNGKMQASVRGVQWSRVPSVQSAARKYGARIKQLSR